MSQKFKDIILFFVVITILFFSFKKSIKEKNNNEILEKNFKITEGRIIDYYEVGISNYYLVYSYNVEDKYFENKITNKYFDDCEDTKSCINKKILVKYSLKNHSISKPIW